MGGLWNVPLSSLFYRSTKYHKRGSKARTLVCKTGGGPSSDMEVIKARNASEGNVRDFFDHAALFTLSSGKYFTSEEDTYYTSSGGGVAQFCVSPPPVETCENRWYNTLNMSYTCTFCMLAGFNFIGSHLEQNNDPFSVIHLVCVWWRFPRKVWRNNQRRRVFVVVVVFVEISSHAQIPLFRPG